jgi:hypothetical protein
MTKEKKRSVSVRMGVTCGTRSNAVYWLGLSPQIKNNLPGYDTPRLKRRKEKNRIILMQKRCHN